MQFPPASTPLSTSQLARSQDAGCPPRRLDAWHGIDAGADQAGGAPPLGSDGDFLAMLRDYRCSGGLARAADVIAMLDPDTGVASLARWIVERRVISFEWQAQTWLPWFQFRGADHAPDPALAAVLAVLGVASVPAVRGDWGQAHWFARPHDRLGGCRPLDLLAGMPGAVLAAAGADAVPAWS